VEGELNLKQVASRLGVHYMTAYRYVRQGRLDARRDGEGWRVAPAALAAFLAGAGDRPSAARGADWSARLEGRLLAADEPAAWQVIEAALAAGRSPEYCYVEMLAGALAHIGERWAAGELDVADQHLATAVVARLVARLGARFRRPGRARGTAVFGAAPGELHSLPIAIASDLVRLRGYDVLELGADVPPEAFVSAAARTPRLICIGIGVTQPELLGAVQQVLDAVRAHDGEVPVLVGGLAAATFGATRLRGVSGIAADGAAAVALVERFAAARTLRAV